MAEKRVGQDYGVLHHATPVGGSATMVLTYRGYGARGQWVTRYANNAAPVATATTARQAERNHRKAVAAAHKDGGN